MAYMIDATGISIGSLFGSPPVTAYIESGAGISEGGKTGITACVTGLCFFIRYAMPSLSSAIESDAVFALDARLRPVGTTAHIFLPPGCYIASSSRPSSPRSRHGLPAAP